MTDGGVSPPADQGGRQPVLGWRGRLEAIQRAVMRWQPVVGIMDVLRAYERSGGGMLAAALSYFAFFTMVPALILFVGLLGVLVEDARLREDLIGGLVEQVDPIADLADFLINQVADTGRLTTLVGVVGLLWGASGFYGALQGAMERMFPGPGGRDFLRTRLRGVVTVVFILGSLIVAVVVVLALPLLSEWLDGRCRALLRIDDPLINPLISQLCAIDFGQVSAAVAVVGAMAVAFLAALVVYIATPTSGPTLRQAFWPAVVVGIAIGLFTSLFGWVAPLLVRHWLALGLVGSVFIALIWFNLVFQALIFGAAFARLRRDRDRLRDGPPSF